MEVTKVAEIEEKSAEAAVDSESVVAEDTEDVGPGQHLFGEPLEMYLLREPKLAVAFSGGCDSALLLAAAKLAGCEVHAYLVKTAFQPDFELDDARTVAAALEVPLTVVEADVLAQADICANPADRCYLCKRFIFSTILERLEEDGFAGTPLAAGPPQPTGSRSSWTAPTPPTTPSVAPASRRWPRPGWCRRCAAPA